MMTQPIGFNPLRASQSVAKSAATHLTQPNRTDTAPPVTVAKLTALVHDLALQPPPVDHARIAQLRQAIASGDYRIDAQKIAGAMIDHFGWTGA
jgi:negative regulator of flagellin synthesis FlgM